MFFLKMRCSRSEPDAHFLLSYSSLHFAHRGRARACRLYLLKGRRVSKSALAFDSTLDKTQRQEWLKQPHKSQLTQKVQIAYSCTIRIAQSAPKCQRSARHIPSAASVSPMQ